MICQGCNNSTSNGPPRGNHAEQGRGNPRGQGGEAGGGRQTLVGDATLPAGSAGQSSPAEMDLKRVKDCGAATRKSRFSKEERAQRRRAEMAKIKNIQSQLRELRPGVEADFLQNGVRGVAIGAGNCLISTVVQVFTGQFQDKGFSHDHTKLCQQIRRVGASVFADLPDGRWRHGGWLQACSREDTTFIIACLVHYINQGVLDEELIVFPWWANAPTAGCLLHNYLRFSPTTKSKKKPRELHFVNDRQIHYVPIKSIRSAPHARKWIDLILHPENERFVPGLISVSSESLEDMMRSVRKHWGDFP